MTGRSILCISTDVDHLLQADLFYELVLHGKEHLGDHIAGAHFS